jgi:hypothetical protein
MESIQHKKGIAQEARIPGLTERSTLNKIPDHFLEWLVSSRIKFLGDMVQGKPLRYFSAHLPVMATWREGDPFPVNMTVKGIGLIPKTEHMQDYTDIFESALAASRTKEWQESLPERVEAMNRLYGDPGKFDSTVLGGLEIFEGKALENLRENPYVSLLYVGMSHGEHGMLYTSFQVNGTVEILGKDSPHYRFLLASRKLFEFDKFHLFQPDYPFGYLIKVLEVRDKSPWSKGGTSRSV